MKKTKVLAVALASFGVLTLASTSVLAAETSKYNTEADIELRDMGPDDPTNPLIDPNDPKKPEVFPTDPGNVVHPNGPLVIDYISRYHFGKVAMSGNNATYNAKLDKVSDSKDGSNPFDVPNFIQVTDNRGNSAGWTLSVRMTQDFKAEDANQNEVTLDKASITLKNTEMMARENNKAPIPTIYGEGKQVTVSTEKTGLSMVGAATTNQGMGSWAVTQGHAVGATPNAAESVQLFVPGESKKIKDAKYTGILEWVLTDDPGVTTP